MLSFFELDFRECSCGGIKNSTVIVDEIVRLPDTA